MKYYQKKLFLKDKSWMGPLTDENKLQVDESNNKNYTKNYKNIKNEKKLTQDE